jgi:hypothetical protein
MRSTGRRRRFGWRRSTSLRRTPMKSGEGAGSIRPCSGLAFHAAGPCLRATLGLLRPKHQILGVDCRAGGGGRQRRYRFKPGDEVFANLLTTVTAALQNSFRAGGRSVLKANLSVVSRLSPARPATEDRTTRQNDGDALSARPRDEQRFPRGLKERRIADSAGALLVRSAALVACPMSSRLGVVAGSGVVCAVEVCEYGSTRRWPLRSRGCRAW